MEIRLKLIRNRQFLCSVSILKFFIVQELKVVNSVSEALKGEKLDAIICVAGGWAGGNAKTGTTVNKKYIYIIKKLTIDK